jgi:hypothetical protein
MRSMSWLCSISGLLFVKQKSLATVYILAVQKRPSSILTTPLYSIATATTDSYKAGTVHKAWKMAKLRAVLHAPLFLYVLKHLQDCCRSRSAVLPASIFRAEVANIDHVL